MCLIAKACASVISTYNGEQHSKYMALALPLYARFVEEVCGKSIHIFHRKVGVLRCDRFFSTACIRHICLCTTCNDDDRARDALIHLMRRCECVLHLYLLTAFQPSRARMSMPNWQEMEILQINTSISKSFIMVSSLSFILYFQHLIESMIKT